MIQLDIAKLRRLRASPHLLEQTHVKLMEIENY